MRQRSGSRRAKVYGKRARTCSAGWVGVEPSSNSFPDSPLIHTAMQCGPTDRTAPEPTAIYSLTTTNKSLRQTEV
uniref:Uncharacterized protein n=1 Tax=Heterorhabditis bacteriophora TaxID=37862 RepID=A0A1I7WSB1_HETBA